MKIRYYNLYFLILITLSISLVLSCVKITTFEPSSSKPIIKAVNKIEKKKMSLKEAVEILSIYIIRDAVIPTRSGAWHNSPALADIDGDGDLEIIVGTTAWHHDGRPYSGWPLDARDCNSSIAVGDVDKDGSLEIATSGYLYRADGSLMTGWQTRIGRSNYFCTPSMDDVDGDGDLEILSTDLELGVCLRHHNGDFLPGWPVSVTGNDVRNTPMAHDVDNDGIKEIIFLHNPTGEIRIHRLDGKQMKIFSLGKVWAGDCFVLADTNDDGVLELVYEKWAYDLTNGNISELKGSSGSVTPCLIKDPNSGEVMIMGPILPMRPASLPNDISGNSGYYSDSVVIADIDGDGQLEFLFGNREGGYHAYRINRTQAAGWPKRLAPSGDSAMAIGDLDGDGFFDVVINSGGGRIYVFDCPGSADGLAPLPLFLSNNQRTGRNATTPCAQPKKVKPNEYVQVINKACSSGDWDTTIEIYKKALSIIEKKQKKIGQQEADSFRQNGYLSIARILNTRARRFEEAVEFYKKVAQISPNSWQTYQALTECSDIVELYPNHEQAQQSLKEIVTVSIPHIENIPDPDATLFRYVLAKACLQINNIEEGTNLLEYLKKIEAPKYTTAKPQNQKEYDLTQRPKTQKKIIPSASKKRFSFLHSYPLKTQPESLPDWSKLHFYFARLAEEILQYEGLPFLISFQEERSYHLKSSVKDLASGSPADAKTLYQLEINPHSSSETPFPAIIKLSAPQEMSAILGKDWNKTSNNRIEKIVTMELPSSHLNSNRCNRIDLFTQEGVPELPIIIREIEMIDNTHMLFKALFKIPFSRAEFGFSMPGKDARIIPSSVKPVHGASSITDISESLAYFHTSGLCRCGCGRDVNEIMNFKDGVYVEAVVELSRDVKPFYPEVLVRAWGGGEEINVQPKSPTNQIKGSFEGIDYEISSSQRFKILESVTDIFYAFELNKLDVDAEKKSE